MRGKLYYLFFLCEKRAFCWLTGILATTYTRLYAVFVSARHKCRRCCRSNTDRGKAETRGENIHRRNSVHLLKKELCRYAQGTGMGACVDAEDVVCIVDGDDR